MKMKKTLSLISAIALLASMTSCEKTNIPQTDDVKVTTAETETAVTEVTDVPTETTATSAVSETTPVTSEVTAATVVTTEKKEQTTAKKDESPKKLPKASEKIAEEKLEDFFEIDGLMAGFIKFDNNDSVSVDGANYYRVLDGEKISSIDELQKLIKNTLTGSLASKYLGFIDGMYVEKDGKLYAREAGRGSLFFDLSQGIVLSDVTDRSFTVTPNENSTLYGTGEFKFAAEDGEWKISEYELFTGDDAPAYEQSRDAVQKMDTFSDLQGLFSGVISYDESDSIKSDDRTFYRVKDIPGYGDVSSLKTAVNNTCTGSIREILLNRIEDNFIEKDGTLYVWILPASYYSFRTDGGVSITDNTETSFTATTNESDALYGTGTAYFVLEDGNWLISNFEFN